MCASFMVDPLGLELVDRIGVDRVMWSTDFPHNESTYGYSNESLGVRRRRGRCRVDAAAIVGGNIRRYLGLGRLMPAGLMAPAPPARIPATADLGADAPGAGGAGPRRRCASRGSTRSCSSATRNVVYATGAIWPLADSGRANFEQPVAVVLADDEWPHLFSPVRERRPARPGAARRSPPRPGVPRLRRGRGAVRRRSSPTSCRTRRVDRHRRVDPRPAPGAVVALRRRRARSTAAG